MRDRRTFSQDTTGDLAQMAVRLSYADPPLCFQGASARGRRGRGWESCVRRGRWRRRRWRRGSIHSQRR
jgi:hypothetical protein